MYHYRIHKRKQYRTERKGRRVNLITLIFLLLLFLYLIIYSIRIQSDKRSGQFSLSCLLILYISLASILYQVCQSYLSCYLVFNTTSYNLACYIFHCLCCYIQFAYLALSFLLCCIQFSILCITAWLSLVCLCYLVSITS